MKERALRIASCQFPISGDIRKNARYIRRYLKAAADEGAHLLHTPETCLSGYYWHHFSDWKDFDWDLLRAETARIRELSTELGLWLVLGSSHWLDKGLNPTNCLYLIDPRGRIVDRYDKCMCTPGCDQKGYSAGNRLVTRTINGVKIGLAICYDACYPQIYAAYRTKKVEVMIHSFENAGGKGPSCLGEMTPSQVVTRCADNVLWAVANNASEHYAAWGSFVARPDGTTAQRLPRGKAGMLIHDFPDTIPENGWTHNKIPLRLAKNQEMWFGKPSNHPRQENGKSEP